MRVFKLAVCLSPALCAAPALAAPKIAVGTCAPQFTSVATIGAAVAAIGTNGTIEICPGTYPEQVVITRSMNLTGLTAGNSSYPTITVPAGGLVQNTLDLDGAFPTAAQLLITNGATVNIKNLTVDGTGNNVQTCGLDPVGVMFQNASGSIKSSAVLNQVLPAGYTGCQSGLAIYAESGNGGTAAVAIEGNVVQNFDKNGITANDAGTTATISGNTVIGQGSWNGAGQNSIQMAFGATGSISKNVVGDDIWGPDQLGDTGDAATGILVYGSAGVSITGNSVTSTQYGISVDYDSYDGLSANNTTISGNMIANTIFYDGIDLCGASNSTISKNSVNGSASSGIHIDSSCGIPSTGSSVSGNIVNSACAGILVGSGSDTPGGANTLLNTVNQVVTGSDVCPVGSQAHFAKVGGARRAAPFRP
jgi:parallel beta-helix repeat protein